MKNHYFPAGAAVAVMLCAVLFGPAYAADSTFSVDSYIPQKFTDFQLRLDGGFKFTGKNEKREIQHGVDKPPEEYRDSSDVREIMGAVDIMYRYETIPHYWRFSLNMSGHTFHASGNLGYSSYWMRDHGKGIHPTTEAGYYLLSDLLISFIGKAGWDYSTGSGDYHDRTYSFDISLLPGWGRIYEGQYAATSMYIVDELRKANVLIQEPDYNDMLQLTELVHQYRQTHVIDSRLHKIEALSKIMDYLRENGVIDSIGPYGCLLIQDVWEYFPATSRRFGFRCRIGAGWQYEYFSSSKSDEKFADGVSFWHFYEHEKKNINRPYMIGVLEWGKPFGLHWQVDFLAEGKHFVKPFGKTYYNETMYLPAPGFHHEDETYYKYDADNILTVSSAVRYIYNSRTSGSLQADYDLRHYHWRRQTQYSGYYQDSYGGTAGGRDHRVGELTAVLEYRISVPTTLLVAVVYSIKEWTEDYGGFDVSDIDTHGYYFTAELIHYLF